MLILGQKLQHCFQTELFMLNSNIAVSPLQRICFQLYNQAMSLLYVGQNAQLFQLTATALLQLLSNLLV